MRCLRANRRIGPRRAARCFRVRPGLSLGRHAVASIPVLSRGSLRAQRWRSRATQFSPLVWMRSWVESPILDGVCIHPASQWRAALLACTRKVRLAAGAQDLTGVVWDFNAGHGLKGRQALPAVRARTATNQRQCSWADRPEINHPTRCPTVPIVPSRDVRIHSHEVLPSSSEVIAYEFWIARTRTFSLPARCSVSSRHTLRRVGQSGMDGIQTTKSLTLAFWWLGNQSMTRAVRED